ncbi:MAG TPA: hypothetical protein VJ249_05200 [Candidatus Bathyarchaeia archaeon]|nr:hypothetical protein [Candidatus Bathyarchaeia archaeon]
MKNNSTPKTTTTAELDLDSEPERTGEEPLIEIEIPVTPDTLEKPSRAHRKKEAAKPMYLIRYE